MPMLERVCVINVRKLQATAKLTYSMIIKLQYGNCDCALAAHTPDILQNTLSAAVTTQENGTDHQHPKKLK